MKSVKEVVRKALLNNGTKDDMYKDIVAEFGCSRHAAKVLLHSFIWECSEAYMVHAAFSESNLQADKDLLAPHDLREQEHESIIKTNTMYLVKDVKTGFVVATIRVDREVPNCGFEGAMVEAEVNSVFSCLGNWLITYEGFIVGYGKTMDYKLEM